MYIEPVLIIGAAIYAIIEVLKKAFPKFLKRDLPTRFLPFIVLVMGAAAFYFLPNIELSSTMRIALGIVAGSLASQSHNIYKKALKGE